MPARRAPSKKPSLKACSDCGTLNPRDAQVCSNCGSSRLTEDWEGMVVTEGGGLRSRIARRALNLVEEVGVVVLGEVEGGVDDVIVALALSLKSRCRVIVATNDRVLRRRLRRIGVPTMYYRRARGGLEVDWHPVF
jgi:RNA polymerase subunit RPABC4/transcription elongation factor Spt4